MGGAEDPGTAVGGQVRGGFERGSGDYAIAALDEDTGLGSGTGSGGTGLGIRTIEIAERVSEPRCPCTVLCESMLVGSLLRARTHDYGAGESQNAVPVDVEKDVDKS